MTIVGIIFTLSLIGVIKWIFKKSKKTENTTTNTKENEEDIKIKFENSTTQKGKYLIFDTETTGLLSDRYIDPDNCDTSKEPHPVQLAWLLLDADFKLVNQVNYIIKQNCSIPSAAANIHGISTSTMKKEGVLPTEAYSKFIKDVDQATDIIGHNIEFDLSILKIDFRRNDIDINIFNKKNEICTMKSSTNIVKLNNGKFPKLNELYGFLFYNRIDLSFEGQHNAMNDVLLTAKCHEQLVKKHKLKPKFDKRNKLVIKELKANSNNADPSNLFFKKTVAFSGTLTEHTRQEAAEKLKGMGAIIRTSITAKTNIVISGQEPGEKKLLQIEELKQNGSDILIMEETEFLKTILN